MSPPPPDLRPQHQQQLKDLATSLAGNTRPLRLKKKTISNLFRYNGRPGSSARLVDLSGFNRPLYLDAENQTLEVQGLATFESIVDFVLPQKFLPLVTPELKHITIGGSTAGIGIESNSYRYGFVHDSLLEADVLLPTGQVVTCSPDNQYADLFYGLPNSYGTLGYILRAKIKLRPARPFVKLTTVSFDNIPNFLSAFKLATEDQLNDYIESLVFSTHQMYLTIGRQTDSADRLTSIYGSTIFYRQISRPGDIWLTTKDYLFRYDPEMFWGLPETKSMLWFRKIAPPSLRNSAFYARFFAWQSSLGLGLFKDDDSLEKLIQDWEVPWPYAEAILNFALDNLDLDSKPLLPAAIKTAGRATNYPMQPNQLYFNLGSYNNVRKQPNRPVYHSTKIMDQFCFDHQGIKMLYSSTFISQTDFNQVYNGQKYAALKTKYDPQTLLPTLYDKAVKAK